MASHLFLGETAKDIVPQIGLDQHVQKQQSLSLNKDKNKKSYLISQTWKQGFSFGHVFVFLVFNRDARQVPQNLTR